jgi:hypothetical protein
MLKYLVLCLQLCIASKAQAQLELLRSDMPTSGDTARVMNAAVRPGSGVAFAATGPDFRWDFADLQAQTEELKQYQPALQTPYFFFLTAYGTKVQDSINLFVTSLQQIYEFYNLNNNRFATTGRGFTVNGIPLPAFFSDPDELFFLPLTYGRNDSSTFAFGLNIPSVGEYKSRGGRKTEVDGWGKVQTPQGSYDCIRVKSTVRTLDSITFNGLNLGLPLRTTIEYYWLSNTEKVPVLKVTGSSVFNQFTPNAIQYRYQPSNPGPQELKLPIAAGEVRIFPNPANEKATIAVNALDKIEAIQWFDAFGKLVKAQVGPVAEVDLQDLSSGVYSLRVYGQYGIYNQKLVVAH